MVWVFQGLVSNGLQVCLSIAAGWFCAKFRFLDPVQLNTQLNRLAMSTCFPAFIIHLLGIKTDLQILEAWKTLGVFILWVICVQIAVVLWCTLFERGEPWRKGLHVLLLTANNYGVVGSVLLQPTLGPVATSVCMLTGVSMWLQMVPSAITFLEWQKWLDAKSPTSSRPASKRKLMTSPPPNTASEREPLLIPAAEVFPPRHDPASSDAAATGFPHEYRYCYWTNEDYAPSQSSLKQQHKQASQASTPTATAAALRRRPSAPVRALAQLPGKDLTQQDIDAMLDPAAEDLGETIGPSPFADPAALSFRLATAPSSGLPTAAQLEAQRGKQRLLPSNSNASSLMQQSQAARSVQPGRISMSNTITSNRPSQYCFDQMSRRSSMGSLPPDLSGFSFSVLPASSGPSVLRQHAHLAGCMLGSAVHQQQQQQATMSSDAQLIETPMDAASLVQTDAHASVQLLQGQGSLSSKASLHLQLEQADLLISAEGDISRKQLIAAGQRYSCQPGDAMLQQHEDSGEEEEEEEGWYFGMGGGVTLQCWVQTFTRFLQTHPQLWAILSVPLKNHLLWVQVFALILSASGVRRYLDDSTPQYVAELGWIDGVLTWFSSASIPVTLFSTGAWICGKQLISRRNIKKVITYMAIKLLVLPCIMLGLAKMAQVDETRGMALLALCSCPVAQVAQVLAQQYGADPETATSVSLLGTLLMVPHLVGLFKVVDTFQLFKYTMISTQ